MDMLVLVGAFNGQHFVFDGIRMPRSVNSFSIRLRKGTMDPFSTYRRNSRGPCNDPPARVHPKIMFGPGFYLTSQFIAKYRITHVINCADDSVIPSNIQKHFGSNYVSLNAIDSSQVDITDWYPLFEHNMNEFLRESDVGVVYVNCQMGMNRSGFLVTLYACMKFGYPYEAITRAILLQRPCALMNSTFHEQVQTYIKKQHA
jgi:hypothetical protein